VVGGQICKTEKGLRCAVLDGKGGMERGSKYESYVSNTTESPGTYSISRRHNNGPLRVKAHLTPGQI
jgi:hypothetical protein